MVARCNNSVVVIVGGRAWWVVAWVPIAGMYGMPGETWTEGSSWRRRTVSGGTVGNVEREKITWGELRSRQFGEVMASQSPCEQMWYVAQIRIDDGGLDACRKNSGGRKTAATEASRTMAR